MHLDDLLEPYYYIRMEDGREKQADNAHITLLKECPKMLVRVQAYPEAEEDGITATKAEPGILVASSSPASTPPKPSQSAIVASLTGNVVDMMAKSVPFVPTPNLESKPSLKATNSIDKNHMADAAIDNSTSKFRAGDHVYVVQTCWGQVSASWDSCIRTK